MRGYKAQNRFAPEQGYVYSGLYRVKRAWRERGKAGYMMCKFEFERLGGQDPLPTFDHDEEGEGSDNDAESEEEEEEVEEVSPRAMRAKTRAATSSSTTSTTAGTLRKVHKRAAQLPSTAQQLPRQSPDHPTPSSKLQTRGSIGRATSSFPTAKMKMKGGETEKGRRRKRCCCSWWWSLLPGDARNAEKQAKQLNYFSQLVTHPGG